MGLVKIGDHTFELPDDEARTLGEAALIAQRRNGWISPTDDLMISITAITPISIEIEGEFADEISAKPAAIIERAQKRKTTNRMAIFHG